VPSARVVGVRTAPGICWQFSDVEGDRNAETSPPQVFRRCRGTSKWTRTEVCTRRIIVPRKWNAFCPRRRPRERNTAMLERKLTTGLRRWSGFDDERRQQLHRNSRIGVPATPSRLPSDTPLAAEFQLVQLCSSVSHFVRRLALVYFSAHFTCISITWNYSQYISLPYVH